tara:strand:- start:469 stop:594 length:126 start_codon:yes stop_codon:yes gene_type:complete
MAILGTTFLAVGAIPFSILFLQDSKKLRGINNKEKYLRDDI